MVTFQLPGGEIKSDAYSAFVISAEGLWFLVTAGHVPRRIRELTEKGCEYKGAALVDNFGTGAKYFAPITFDLRTTQPSIQEDDVKGTDLAVYALGELYCRQLAANGIVPLAEGQWNNPSADFDGCFVIGLPSQFIKQVGTDDRPGEIDTTVVWIPLRPCSEPAEMKKGGERFYAKLPDDIFRSDGVELKDVDGMSGGPIFIVKKLPDGSQKYCVLALQTSWRRDLRVIAGNYIKPVGEGIAAAVREVVAEQATRAGNATVPPLT